MRLVRERDLPLTVRAGGHSVAGLSTAPDGVLLDLRQMDRIDVDPTARLVRVGGGATWGAVARTAQPHGLGLTAGDTANVGVGGQTLGGGIGWMVRWHGLAIDSLVGAEVVTADGQALQVSATEHPDLFWVLRGGGGAFGVVTRFDFIAQPVDDVVFGTVVYALDDPEAVLTAWRDAQRNADERLTTVVSLQPARDGQPATAMLKLCFAGSEADAAGVVGPLFDIGTVLSSDVSMRPHGDVLEDVDVPAGMRFAVRNALLPELGAAELAALDGLFRDGGTVITLRALGGAVCRVEPEATAFAHRCAEVMAVAMRMLPADAVPYDEIVPDDDAVPGWDSVAAHSVGAYVNFLSAGADAADGYPPETIARLARVKAHYDPDNVFQGSIDIRREVTQ